MLMKMRQRLSKMSDKFSWGSFGLFTIFGISIGVLITVFTYEKIVDTHLLDNYKVAIEDAISSDVDPYTFVKNIANDMQLSDNGGFMSHDTPAPQPTTIKYL